MTGYVYAIAEGVAWPGDVPNVARRVRRKK